MSHDKPESAPPAEAGSNDPVSQTSPAEAAPGTRDVQEVQASTQAATKARWYPDNCFTELLYRKRHVDARHVLVPIALHDQVMRERKEEDEEKERQTIEEANAEKLDSAHYPGTYDPRSQKPEAVAGAETEGSSSQESAVDDAPAEKVRAKRPRRQPTKPISSKLNVTGFHIQLLEAHAKDKLRVHSDEASSQLLKSSQSADSDVNKRNKGIADMLQRKGPFRRIGAPRRIADVLSLKASHPHFGTVIDFVANQLELAKVSKRPVRIPPMLLSGPPGVGKTHFSDALAKVLGVPTRRHQMDQAETSSALLGSEATWSNSRTGLVFEELVHGDYANPVILLDELDKAPSRDMRMNPVNVLHTLLEPVSAAHVRDLSVDLEIDASMVTWIATCNYPWRVPFTLRTRMKEFFIGMPTAEQALLVARSVINRALADAGVPGFKQPGRDVIVALAPLSAREIYQVVIAAVATAVKHRQRFIGTQHLPPELLLDDGAEEGGGGPRVRLH